MPHPRLRYARRLIRELSSHSPIVGVLGQRQAGKTTLVEEACGEYATLDSQETLSLASREPSRFLRNRAHPFAIDECQLAPPLFPALKEHVRIHPKKGQFLLTGSVRFTSRRAIRESLTGRIVNLELLPLSPAESHSEPLPEQLLRWLKMKSFLEAPQISSRILRQITGRFQQFLITGGLPGICFFREHHIRAARFETQLETLLERDIRLLLNTPVSYRNLKELLRGIAIAQGLPINYSKLARRAGVSTPTAIKLLHAMESMFLVRSISTEGTASPVFFLEDQGMATYLIGDQADPARDLVRGLFSCILPQFLYRPETVPIFHQYRTRGGAEVDIVVRTHQGTIGIIPVEEEEATPSAIASARSFLSRSSSAKVIIAHTGTDAALISTNLISVPYPLLVSDHHI